ncbi:MAG: 3-dehydroquinate synthase [Pseudomonadota bacterium]
MKSLEIEVATGHSVIAVGERLGNLGKYLPPAKVFIVTDTNVAGYYRKAFPPFDILTIGTGEKIKNLDTVRDLYGRLLALEADRTCFILGIGGGIVCDITGFVASTYLRGLRFGFVSTTLLSQVDASVGGKNGVNFGGYKNMVGVFNQPEFVLCDMTLLETLPEKEILSGLGEIVKHALIGDAALFAYLDDHCEGVRSLDPSVLERLVYDSVVLKASVVNQDEKEKGERRKLNFGHTFGHAIEKITGVLHGEAVSAGMAMAIEFSVKRGHLSGEEREKALGLLGKFNLPTGLPVDRAEMLVAMRRDKKRSGDRIHFVFLKGIGQAVVEEVSFREL